MAAKFDEMCAFLGALREQHTIIGNDAYRAAFYMGKTGDKGFAVARFEFVKAAGVDQTGDYFADVVGHARVGRDQPEDFIGVIGRIFRGLPAYRVWFGAVQGTHRIARQGQRVGIIFGQIVGHTAEACMHIAAAKVFGRHHFASGGLDQRRPGQKYSPLIAHDDRDIRHGRNVSAPGGARPHDHGYLWDALG